ncbi:MAG: FkbM family methyltransferase [Phycisphaeraceae bacterium]
MKPIEWIKREYALRVTKSVTREMTGITGRFHVNSKQEYKVVAGGLSEPELRSAVFDLLRPDDVVFEIGAHIGSWSIYIAKRVVEGELHVFEPVPGNYEKLVANLDLNALNHVTAYACALGDTPGQASFYVPGNNASGIGALHDNHKSQTRISVEVRTVDEVAAGLMRPPTFLKIDCEGAEAMVLRGARATLRQSVRCIFLEVHKPFLKEQGEDADQMIRDLLDAGFVVRRRWGDESDARHLLLEREASA